MDLNAPLGMNPPPPRQRAWGLVVAGTLAVLVLGGLGAYLVTADPHGGEPFATAAIPPPKPVAPAPPTDPTPTGSLAAPPTGPLDAPRPAASVANGVRMENGVRVVSPLVGAPAARGETGPMVIDVSKALDSAARKAAAEKQAPGLQATAQPTLPPAPTPQAAPSNDAAPLPKVATLPGAKIPSATAPGASGARVAIFVGGLGLSDGATRTAIELLPPAVSLAFVPYGDKVAAAVGDAKARGHEILLQLPMQGPRGAPPGPHALRADEPATEMNADLDWLATRFEGYAGATNLLGADVTADAAAMRAILGAVGRRNLFYVDDGTSRRSVAPSIAGELDVPAVRADVVLDATGDPAVVRTNLEKLAAIARAKGTAIGVASGLSDHLAIVARFATDLGGRGIALVPVGTLARGGGSIATTR